MFIHWTVPRGQEERRAGGRKGKDKKRLGQEAGEGRTEEIRAGGRKGKDKKR